MMISRISWWSAAGDLFRGFGLAVLTALIVGVISYWACWGWNNAKLTIARGMAVSMAPGPQREAAEANVTACNSFDALSFSAFCGAFAGPLLVFLLGGKMIWSANRQLTKGK